MRKAMGVGLIMKTIKVNNKELLLVPVPKNANSFGLVHQRTRVGYFVSDKFVKIDLPFPDYEIVNTLSKLTEEQALTLDLNLESLKSLMIANEIDTNNEYLILIKNNNGNVSI